MTDKKRCRIYEMYQTFDGTPTCWTKDKHGEDIYHVAAVSIKQAYYFLGTDTYATEDDLGIVAEYHGGFDADAWRYADGSVAPVAYFKHGQTFNAKLFWASQ